LRPFIPKGGGFIQIYFYVLPPIPTGSFWKFSSLAIFPSFWVPDFWGHFEAIKNVFRALYRYIVIDDKV
jgi:hypothetical protein